MRFFHFNPSASASRLLSAASLLLWLVPAASAQAPCADARSLVNFFAELRGGSGLIYPGGVGAFFPKDSHYDGSANPTRTYRCQLVLDKDGQEVGRWPMLVQDEGKVFQRFQPTGQTPIYQLTEAGSFVVAVEFDGQDVTSVPFHVEATASTDPFNPGTFFSVDSGLLGWAQLVVGQRSSQESIGVDFHLRARDLGLPKGAKVEINVERQGRVVYTCGTLGASVLGDGENWRSYSKEFRYPDTKGGGFLPYSDFTKVDGIYRVVARSGGRALRAWEFQVEDGAVVAHPRSSFSHAPATEYLLSQVVLPENGGVDKLFWLEPVADPEAGAEAAPAAEPISAAVRAAWKPAAAAPKRAPSVVVTDIAARVDAHLAAGDGVVAYGTGPNTGVALLRCGEDEEILIPGGAEFSSKAFFFCGKKLVLVKGSEVAIYDTESGSMTAIPGADVTLQRRPMEFLKGRHIDADGQLVAVICDPKKVSDRRVVKVIDLSGAAPRVINLGFPDATPKELVSIAVDAAAGTVVLGSDRKNCLFVASITEEASFRAIDLSGHDGLNKDCAPIVRAGKAAVFDSTGTRKLRIVDLESGSVKTLCGLAKSLRWFDFDGERVALASDVSYGSSYEVRMGSLKDGQPEAPAGAGESASYGKAGYAQRVALTSEGLVFAAGHGAGGISKGEVLLVSDGEGWHEVQRAGAALPAVDVTAGIHVMAFKTGKSRDARVGYVLLGAGMGPAGIGVDG